MNYRIIARLLLSIGMIAVPLTLTAGPAHATTTQTFNEIKPLSMERTTECGIGLWNFNECAGLTVEDVTGNGHDGDVYGASWVSGMSGCALDYDGDNDYVSIPGGAWLTQLKGTVAAWVYIDPAGAGGRIISTETTGWANGLHVNWGNQLSNNQYINGGIYGGIHSTEGGNHYVESYIDDVTKGEWHFMAFIWDGDVNSLMVYVDGATSTVISPNSGISDTGEPLTIGCWINQGYGQGGWFDGKVDELQLYSCALTTDELDALYQPCSPIACWDFNECTGLIAGDISGNGHDGNINGAPWAPGVHGAALEYDGDDDYVSMPGGDWLTQLQGTVAAWIYVDPEVVGCRIISTEAAGWHDGLHMGYNYEDSFDIPIPGSGFVFGIHSTEGTEHYAEVVVPNVSKGQWHFVAFVWDGATDELMAFYDGEVYLGNIPHSGIAYTGEPFAIGCWTSLGSGAGSWFQGMVDEVHYYGFSLTVPELCAIWQTTIPAFLSQFSVVQENSDVKISWTTAWNVESQQFRVTTIRDGREREVPHQSGDNGKFSASDALIHGASGETVSYLLSYCGYGRDWTVLADQTLYLDIPEVATRLHCAQPNPFNPNTSISFTVDRQQTVRVVVYDISGMWVANIADQVYGSGSHSVEWDGRNSAGHAVSSGTYFVRMETAEIVESLKIMLVR